MDIVLENESPASIDSSPDALFQRGTLDAQCRTFSATAMHSTSETTANGSLVYDDCSLTSQ